MTWLTAWAASSKPAEMSMRENGSMTRPKEKECISIKMVLPTLANGLTTNSMATGIKNGVMELSIRETTLKESNRGMDASLG